MASLADIRARLAAQDTKSKGNFKEGDSAVYAHWNIEEESTAILRFLEDGDTSNPYFWVERMMFKFPFNGIKGDPSASSNVVVQVPCMEMYGDKDKILDEVRTWFKDPSLEDMGRKYWKKRSYLFQGFVRQDPMEKAVPENPIRRFMISPQIFTLIKNSLMDPEIEDLPTDQVNGLDFRILKTSKGGYADYSNSNWARKESALTEEEIAAIDEHGLYNLHDFLPKKPTEEVQAIIQEMFEASVEGEAYDPERWGAYYTPPGVARTPKADSASSKPAETKPAETKPAETKPAETKTATTIADDVNTAEANIAKASSTVDAGVAEAKAPAEEAKAPAEESTANKAQDILAMIRSRQQ